MKIIKQKSSDTENRKIREATNQRADWQENSMKEQSNWQNSRKTDKKEKQETHTPAQHLTQRQQR